MILALGPNGITAIVTDEERIEAERECCDWLLALLDEVQPVSQPRSEEAE